MCTMGKFCSHFDGEKYKTTEKQTDTHFVSTWLIDLVVVSGAYNTFLYMCARERESVFAVIKA